VRRISAIAVVALLVGACTHAAPRAADTAIIVVDAPVVEAGAVAQQIVHGAELAAAEINAGGGVLVEGRHVDFSVRVLDSKLSPATSAGNTRTAAGLGAVAIVEEGTGVDASWQIANAAGIPIGIVYQGGMGLVDPRTRPNVFRIAPTDRGVAFRLAEYLIPKGLKIAILRDDSTYGDGGGAALQDAFGRNRSSVTTTITIPASATDVSAQVLQARRSGANAVLVWTRPAMLAAVVRQARTTGWNVPVYAGVTGGDPIVRQQLADHPEWVNGLTFTGSRLTSEKGPAPYDTFRKAFEKRFGVEKVGVRSNARDVTQLPDWAMYSYDFVKVIAGAMAKAGTASPGQTLLRQLNDIDVVGANGDERSFNSLNHEGVVDDDVFFGVFHDMTWAPVRDDPLSASLPSLPQT